MAAVNVLRSFTRNINLGNHSAKATIRWHFQIQRQINTSSCFMADRRYSLKHEWVQLSGTIGTVGITNYAQESLGDIVYAQLPEVGREYSIEDECGALESVKAASELYSPVSCKITEINTEVEEQPALINQSPYEKGWLFKMELIKPEEFKELMEEAEYEKFLKTLDS
uniref:Glycine cleavage system H protein n=1 Tax=Hirondellea gigas TaxID=1518452 RepID=A0A2P2HYE4_9CRUS